MRLCSLPACLCVRETALYICVCAFPPTRQKRWPLTFHISMVSGLEKHSERGSLATGSSSKKNVHKLQAGTENSAENVQWTVNPVGDNVKHMTRLLTRLIVTPRSSTLPLFLSWLSIFLLRLIFYWKSIRLKPRLCVLQVYYQECEMFGLVAKMLIAKDQSLEGPIQSSLQENLRDIGKRCVDAMERFIEDYDSRELSHWSHCLYMLVLC